MISAQAICSISFNNQCVLLVHIGYGNLLIYNKYTAQFFGYIPTGGDTNHWIQYVNDSKGDSC